MKKALFFVIFLSVYSTSIGQNTKLILTNGLGKKVLKRGKILGVTFKGEPYAYDNWRSICKCDNDILPKLWRIDSIGDTDIFLKRYNYKLSFYADTVLRKNIASMRDKNYYLDTVIPSAKGRRRFDMLICSVAQLDILGEDYRQVKYDDIESFTFATASEENCNKRFGKGFHYLNIPLRRGAAIVLLAYLTIYTTVVTTEIVVKDIETQVHRYSLRDWKVRVK